MALGLYLHVPFCKSKCAYCDFVSRPLRDERELEAYVRALCREIALAAPGRADTIYFGGGTPSLCSPRQLEKVLQALYGRFYIVSQPEITLEANPATVTAAQLRVLADLGFNRLSLGVQSTANAGLRTLERIHSAGEAKNLMSAARAAGFGNVSCDLIYAWPGQTLSAFQKDIRTLCCWEPEHISLYALSLEPGTRLADKVARQELPAPDDDAAADMYAWAQEYLKKQGYFQYELSNFARPGKVCRHNLKYWNGEDYLGFGVAAHSYVHGVRSWNFPDIKAYLRALKKEKKPLSGSEKLKKKERIAEHLIIGLRLTEGVRHDLLAARFGPDWQKPFAKAFEKLQGQGLLVASETGWTLTRKGMLLSNIVFRALL